ncbi:MAG TPA: hypothetical protein VF519_01715 [Mycobacteriales bacterium]|jgi:hypothetical protein
MRGRLARAVAIACAAVTALPAPAAQAYTAAVYDGCKRLGPQGAVIRFVFSGDSRWDTTPQAWLDAGTTTTPRARATAAFQSWNVWRNRDATPITRIAPTAQVGSRTVTVALVPAPANDRAASGFFDCPNSEIEVNEALLQSAPSLFWETSAHEMGHVISLMHTGKDDSLDVGWAPNPLMGSCGVTGRGHTTDDVAAIAYHYGVAADDTLTANYGFENGLDFFAASGAAPTVATGSTSGGATHAMVLPNSTADNVHQSVSHARGHEKYVRPSLQYVTPGATTGALRLQLFSRDVTYTSSSGCSWPIFGRNMNLRVNGSFEYEWVLELDDYLPLSSTWRAGTTSYRFFIPFVADANGNEAGATDMRLRLFSSAAIPGGYVHVHYDDVRIQEVA